jgi:hypothetical protein
MDICQIIKIMSQPGKSINDLTNEIGFTAENILQTALLKYIVCINPELSVIYDILYSIPDNLENQQQRTCDFADAVKERDIVCRITGRFAERCQVAHIYKYKDCKNNEEKNMVIRQEMSKAGDFNGILNVLSALRQEDPYMFELCLQSPEFYTNKELEDNFKKNKTNFLAKNLKSRFFKIKKKILVLLKLTA